MTKNLPASAGDSRDTDLIPGSGRSLGIGNGNPLQNSCLENSMDRGAWQSTSPWGHKELDTTKVTEHTPILLEDFPAALVVKNPPDNARDTGDVGSTPGSERCTGEGNDNPFQYSCLENHGHRNLEGNSPWGRKESDATARACALSSFMKPWEFQPVWTQFSSVHFSRSVVSDT